MTCISLLEPEVRCLHPFLFTWEKRLRTLAQPQRNGALSAVYLFMRRVAEVRCRQRAPKRIGISLVLLITNQMFRALGGLVCPPLILAMCLLLTNRGTARGRREPKPTRSLWEGFLNSWSRRSDSLPGV